MRMLVNKPSFHIRNATLNDVRELIELRKFLLNQGTGYYVAQTEEEQMAWQKSYQDWLVKNLNHNLNINVIVACHPMSTSGVVGCAIGIIDERVPFIGCLNGRMGWVQTVVVHPDYRRQNLAMQMMNHLFVWFRENDVNKITLQTTKMAKPLYEKLDFYDSKEDLLIKAL
jgi:N-acetylglutamate synthase-like GNAT family acetyltransferase